MGDDEIVVAVDGSIPSLAAARWAAVEAGQRGLPLRLVHACVRAPTPYPRTRDEQVAVFHALSDHGRTWLREAQGLVERTCPGLDVRQDLRVGQAVAVVLAAARRAVLVVTGARGLGGFDGLAVGSVASGLAHHAPCPVVIVRDDRFPVADEPVVVGVDGSAAGAAALAFAVGEAVLHGVDLEVVHTWSPVAFPDMWAVQPLDADLAALAAREEGLLRRLVEPHRAAHPGLTVRTVVVRDRPVRALLDRAAGARLLVVGGRGRHAHPGVGLGSTSASLTHVSPGPLAVVRAAPVPDNENPIGREHEGDGLQRTEES
ncbi:universal stress protein [Actinokineospora globicatena]|uniref:universal stress protein n=1 Tax=Actinokineospora globicatena TaxID=103729 RepID=UPI0020A26B4B|nr:universal stress protein [Actinokineospora globicatena]MCP2306146.1 Nucleotide-binding universal stress protein, UspA family [Actinokineospora globicatena]GLW79979.1 universal stress protein [Actinokineospora globicatena]GLW86808.1 universal stress protein [Actinokineospora globicatena]